MTAAANTESASARERILDAALEAFSERGFDGATTRAIAAAAGVNLGLIAYYFDDKRSLWEAAVDRAFADLERGLDAILKESASLDDRGRLALLIRQYVRFVAAHPEFVRLMHEEGKRDSDRLHWLVDHHVRGLYGGISRLIEAAQGIGRIAEGIDPLHLHYILAGAVGILFHQAPECRYLTGRDPMDPELVEAHADALVQLLVGTATEETPR